METMKEKMVFLGASECWECGKAFPTRGLRKEADAHEKEFPGFRRANTRCRRHNYGATVLFPRDCEYK